MSPQKSHRTLVAFVIAGLILSAGAGGASANQLLTMDDASVLSTMIIDVEDGTEDEEDSDGGWFDNVVESGGNLVGDAKEALSTGRVLYGMSRIKRPVRFGMLPNKRLVQFGMLPSRHQERSVVPSQELGSR